jgi:DNA-binding SARP family transcriptional activator/tetratricopeptide (TPR) repeat protein
MSETLRIELFGDFRVMQGEQLVTRVDSSRLQELLAYLLLHRNAPQSREYLAFLFWPDSTEKQARTNLRQLLHHLHLSLPDADTCIISTAKTLQWNPGANYQLDVSEFEHLLLLAGNAAQPGEKEHHLRQAVQVYRGDLLKTCYNEWITPDRERLQREHRKALEELMGMLEKKREYAAAIGYARQLLQSDPLHEPVYRHLMRLHAANNDRAGALQVYQHCSDTLRRELSVSPGGQTKALYNQLLLGAEAETAPNGLGGEVAPRDEWPLVGRFEEWEALQNAWIRTLSAGKQLVIIEGEPGIGKTRLGFELLHWTHRQGYPVVRTRCYEAAGALSYTPISELLNTPILRRALPKLDAVWLSEVSRLLPDLLVEHKGLLPPGPLQESWQRQKFFEALSRGFTAEGKPKVVYIDDLQWCDHETLYWLHYFLRFEKHAPMLVVCTLRSAEYALNEPLKKLLSDLRKESQLVLLRLGPLNAQHTVMLAKAVAGLHATGPVSNGLFSETEGNPLFIVESIRRGESTAQEAVQNAQDSSFQTAPHATFVISPKVNEVIAARFAKLSVAAREVMSLGAVIGREFSFEALRQAANRAEGDLIAALEELMQHSIIREQASGDFDFSHDKLREVAYLGMSNARRRWLHRTVAETLEKKGVPQPATLSSRLAYHFDRAGVAEKAVQYYREAATHAQAVFANYEAISFLKRAIVLVEEIPAGEGSDQLASVLHTQLALALVHLKGYGALEVHQACERALLLSRKVTQTSDSQVLRILAIVRVVNANYASGYELGAELLALAEHTHNAVLRVEAHYVMGVAQHWRGNYREAKAHFCEVLHRYDPAQSATHIHLYGQDPSLICRIRLANVLLVLGEVAEAEACGTRSLEAGIACGHPFSLGYVRNWLAWMHNVAGKVSETRREAEASVAYSTKYEFPFWYTISKMLLGWALTEGGERERGIALLRENANWAQTTNNQTGLSYFWCLLARALAETGAFTEAFEWIEKAYAQMQQTGEYWMEAELYRLKGEMLLKQKPADQEAARAAFEQAIAIARGQGAVYFEQKAQACLRRLV